MAAKYTIKTLVKEAGVAPSGLSDSQLLVYQVVIRNEGAGPIYIGDSSVDATSGYKLNQNEWVSFGEYHDWELDLQDIYVITSGGNSDAHVLYVKRK